MKLLAELALRDLLRDRAHLICNVAVIVGIVLPLLVLFGVKNGVYDVLLHRLLSNPATLQIDTAGNESFTTDDLSQVRSWPETQFATLKTRSLFDFVTVRPQTGGARQEAVLEASGPGDPRLPDAAEIALYRVVISQRLSEQAELSIGDGVLLITQGENRPRQLALEATISGIALPEQVPGRVVLADIALLDLVEAFYDGYAIPDHGITEGRPISDRVPAFEGMRIFADRLESLAPLQSRIEDTFAISTQARTREVQSVMGLGRNLNLALMLTVTIATMGLLATLIFSFWAEIARKRRMVAILGLLGLPARQIAVYPVIQAGVTASVALVLSFLLLRVCSGIVDRLFELGDQPGGLVSVSLAEGVLIALATLVIVMASSALAVWQAMKTDPAIILREES